MTVHSFAYRPAFGLAVLALATLGACASPAPGPAGPAAAGSPAQAVGPIAQSSKLIAHYGGAPFRIDIRHVSMISKAVIAVRRTGRDGGALPEFSVDAAVSMPRSGERRAPFSDRAFEEMAVDLAEKLAPQVSVCGEGAALAVDRDADGSVDRLYRDNRQAWVVFARCKRI